MLCHFLANLFRRFLTLVLVTLLTLLVRNISTLGNLDIFALLVRHLFALFASFIIHMAFFSVGGGALLLALRCAHLFVSSVTLWFLMPVTVFLKLVINHQILVCSAVLALLGKLLDRFDEWDRVANWGWNVSAGLLWDCQAFWNLLFVAFLLRHLLTFLLFLIATDLLWNFCTLFPMVGRGSISGCFVNRFALFAVLRFAFLFLFLMANVLVCGFALFLVLVFAFNLILSLALGLDDLLADLPCVRDTGLHIIISASTATEQVHHIVSSSFSNDCSSLGHCLGVQRLPSDQVGQRQKKCTFGEDHPWEAV